MGLSRLLPKKSGFTCNKHDSSHGPCRSLVVSACWNTTFRCGLFSIPMRSHSRSLSAYWPHRRHFKVNGDFPIKCCTRLSDKLWIRTRTVHFFHSSRKIPILESTTFSCGFRLLRVTAFQRPNCLVRTQNGQPPASGREKKIRFAQW